MYFNSMYILNLTGLYYYFLIYYQYSVRSTHIFTLFIALYLPSFISMLPLGVIFLFYLHVCLQMTTAPFLLNGKCLYFTLPPCVWRSRALLAAKVRPMLSWAVLTGLTG